MSMTNMLQENSSANSVNNQSYVNMLRSKWGGMLSSMKGNDYQKNCMAVLFENQANYMMGLDEDTRASNVGSFLKYVLKIG